MNHAITLELQFFLISILWGGIILLAYDVMRIFRRLVSHDSFFIAVEDLIFWVVASLFIFAMIYRQNNGIIRGFSVMGMIIGMILYHYIFSETLVKLVTKFIRILLQPLIIAFRQVKRFVLFFVKKGKMGINSLLYQLKKWNKSGKIALKAWGKKSRQSARRKADINQPVKDTKRKADH